MTLSLDSINQSIESRGASWVNLRSKAEAILDGVVVSVDERVKTFEGKPVLSRKSGEPRKEWVFALQTERRETDDDDGIRKFAANESAQRAIADAVKDSGQRLAVGSRLKIGVIDDPLSSTEQATYKAKHEPATVVAPADVSTVSDLLA